MLVYFGAEWCPPCKVLETNVFNQADVEQRLSSFSAVYVDGDAAGTPALMERFEVVAFPTLVAVGADGRERGRLVGSAEKREVLEFLDSSTQADSPMALLAKAGRGETLSAEQWRVLSEAEVSEAANLHLRGKAGLAEFEELQAALAKAVAALDRNSALAPEVDARLRIKSLVVDAIRGEPIEARSAHGAALDVVLADSSRLAATERDLAFHSEEILDYLAPEDGAAKRSLAGKLLAAMETAYERQGATLSWKMEILMLELPLLPFGSSDVDADKTRFAARVEVALKLASGARERLAMATDAARVLRRTGRELRAEQLLRETHAESPDAYYIADMLAAYARLRDDHDEAVMMSEKAYRLSLRSSSGLAWGRAWISSLIERDPGDIEPIASAAEEVIDRAIRSGEAFRGFRRKTMDAFAEMLSKWMSSGADSTARSRIVGGFRRLCDSVGQDAAQRPACDEAQAVVERLPAA